MKHREVRRAASSSLTQRSLLIYNFQFQPSAVARAERGSPMPGRIADVLGVEVVSVGKAQKDLLENRTCPRATEERLIDWRERQHEKNPRVAKRVMPG